MSGYPDSSCHIFNRVTRLGDFLPIEPSLTLGSFFNYKSSPDFGPLFPWKMLCIDLYKKNGMGFILGNFFHKLIWSH
jgi:hypothetical protein